MIKIYNPTIKYHFLQECVNSGEISIAYINTNDNLADLSRRRLNIVDSLAFEIF
jgi:hypothetical protein